MFVKRDSILVFNAGSASLRFVLFLENSLLEVCRGEIYNINKKPTLKIVDIKDRIIFKSEDLECGYEKGFNKIVNWIKEKYPKHEITAIGHRVVHGGTRFKNSVILNDEIVGELEKLITLAPLHQLYNLEVVKLCKSFYGNVPQIACFDTAFHTTKTKESAMIAIPRRFYNKGIMRYGFHGISYSYIASMIPELTNLKSNQKIIVAHLGNGASMCALQNLESVDTTMSFTPLDGLMMGTRCGDIDPGLVLYFIKDMGMGVDEVYNMLYNESGLLGVSGISHDIKELLNNYSKEAEEAIGLFAYRAVKQLAGLIATLGGFDALIFTGGVGENSPVIRQAICDRLIWLEVDIDHIQNEKNKLIISSRASKVDIYVIPTDEEKMIAKECHKLVKA